MKSFPKTLILLSILLLCSWSATSFRMHNSELAVTITGTVRNAVDGSLLPGVKVQLKGAQEQVVSQADGSYEIVVPAENAILIFSRKGYVSQEIKVGTRRRIDVHLKTELSEVMEADLEVIMEMEEEEIEEQSRIEYTISEAKRTASFTSGVRIEGFHFPQEPAYPAHNTEEYATIHENAFSDALKNPLSTFSIDVDNASYSNMRRFINMGQTPPKDVVRIEELINYFTYDYPQPEGDNPFSVSTEISQCPWNSGHQLVHIGLQGKNIPTENLPPSNLVFLIDVSGSMSPANRLPLVKAAFRMLVNELRPQDRVSIVVYAGAAGMVLPSTRGDQKAEILSAIELLEAGGSTAGGAGIQLAYKIAEEHFIKEGNNRVILASDGDFNIGMSSNAAMERLIEEKRASGVFLTVLGFGMGNLKDSKMETLADKGNGNYAYIDNIQEAKKVFVNEFGGTLFTIAKDVKLQVEFNPAKVKGYRLIGYENRALKDEDFNNDKKDAGELGAGHTVTALYEIIPAELAYSPFLQQVDELKYQQGPKVKPDAYGSEEVLTVKLRFKKPDGDTSSLIETTLFGQGILQENTSDDFRFSAAVASFGMLLRDSEYKGTLDYAGVLRMAEGAKGKDAEGYRAEFINLIRSMQLLVRK